MIRKIIKTVITLILILFPFWGGTFISKFTPYIEGNNITHYIIAYCTVAIVVTSILFFLIYRFKDAFNQPTLPGVILFYFGVIMLGISGLAAPPDLSVKMLEHPEREHFRYVLLGIGAMLFTFYSINLYVSNPLNLKLNYKRIAFALFFICMIEFFWEFHHHYYYPEAFKDWINKGNNADDFSKNYDTDIVGTIGSVGRLILYSLILWLTIGLYKVRKLNLWSPIVTSFFCTLGIISSIVMFLYFNFKIETPKETGFLIIFFIPGVPFLILYWIGVALLTRKLVSSN